MPESLPHQFIDVRQGAYLPHWTLEGASYHVVFRLIDSLPASVVEDYRRERAVLLAETVDATEDVRERLQKLFSIRVEKLLDAGHGSCWLAHVEIAESVVSALHHFENKRYRLHAWCVMPNHVHVIVQPSGTHALAGILHSWKSYTATLANRILKREGGFWQKESYDHLIRDADDLDHTVRYVQANPVGAGLKDWPWVWPRPD